MKKIIITFAVTLLLFASCTYDIPNIDKKSKGTAITDSMQKAASASKPIPVSNINVEIAEEVAKSFFALASRQKTRNLSILSRDSIMDWKNRTSIYIFNLQPNGYILTSADIKNEAIIGFSENGSFSAKPEYMSPALIATLAEIIIDNRVEIEGQPKAFNAVWDNNKSNWGDLYCLTDNKKYEFEEDISGDPCNNSPRKLIKVDFSDPNGYFCKTAWEQRKPYNYYAPSHEYPIGCVAVAMGQIMKFHQHPNWFNWNIMPNVCDGEYNNMTEGEKEVARLLRDIGKKTEMSYDKDGAGTTIHKAWSAFRLYGYSAYMPLNWDYNKIVKQLKNRKTPIYARGNAERYKKGWWIFKWYTYERGHAYIIDGIQEMKLTYQYECGGETKTSQTKTEIIHYNLGWGISDIFWLVTNKNRIPKDYWGDLKTQKEFTDYKYKKECLYNINPR